MKRLILFPVFIFLLFLTGCAQMFDANLFQGVDAPPALTAGALSGKSIDEIQAMTADSSFYEQLKDNPAALEAAQTVLETGFSGVTSSSSTADKATAVDSATTYIAVTSKGSAAGGMVTDAILEVSKLQSGSSSDVNAAVTSLVAGKSEAEITALLTNLSDIGSALTAMQTASTVGTSVDSDLFFAKSDNKGELAQTALVAAAVTALVADDPTPGTTADKIANLAAVLAAGGTPTTSTSVTALGDALSGTVTTANSFAYLNAVTSIIKP